MSAELDKAWELLDAGDLRELMKKLRLHADELPLDELALIVEKVADATGFPDLAQASRALAAAPGRPQALVEFGYLCIERGVSYVAVPALYEALRLAPRSSAALEELVTALEDGNRHAEAAAVLREHEATLRAWPDRYLLAYNSLMAGDLDGAAREFARLPEPRDERWQWAHARMVRMLERAATVRSVSPLDKRDLRGWQFVLTGGVLSTLSPDGFDAGMTGRYAFLQDDFDLCRYGLHRLGVILGAAAQTPRTVSLLPDRSSRILGLATTQVLGVPAQRYMPGRKDTVVVAYDLNETDRAVIPQLRERAAGEILYEHATCWTAPPAVPADVSTLLHQVNNAPWSERQLYSRYGHAERAPADIRPVEEVADDIATAMGEPEPGDGRTPADPDEALARFVAGVRDRWLAGARKPARSYGPVPSFRLT